MSVNWGQIITDIQQQRSVALEHIGFLCGVSVTTLHNWRRRDCEPSYSRGEALIQLWCRVTGQPIQRIPRHFN